LPVDIKVSNSVRFQMKSPIRFLYLQMPIFNETAERTRSEERLSPWRSILNYRDVFEQKQLYSKTQQKYRALFIIDSC
jgi:hypothetical protein